MTGERFRCPGTGYRSGGFPGDRDTCPACLRWVLVRTDETLAAHTLARTPYDVAVERWARETRARHAPSPDDAAMSPSGALHNPHHQ